MNIFGRLHPLIVHLPIGILILAFGLECLARFGRRADVRPAIRLSLAAGALTALLAAGTGWLLGQQGGYDEVLLQRHQWSAFCAAALAALAWWGRERNWYFPVFTAAIAVLTLAGHFGGSLTHGAGYLFPSADSGQVASVNTPWVIHPDTAVFAGLIQPILRQKCLTCHNAAKQKGKLRLDTPGFIQKGGEHGAVLVAGQPGKSPLLLRAQLPLHHDDHMPPSGKPQLSDDEIRLLEWWVAQGADFTVKQAALPLPATLAAAFKKTTEATGHPLAGVQVAEAPAAAVQRLRDLFVSVRPADPGTPWLTVSFAGLTSTTKTHWEALRPLGANIIDLDLAFTNVADGVLAGMPHLLRLNLAHTPVTDALGPALQQMKFLESLNLTGTRVSDSLLASLPALPQLCRLYLWQTAVTPRGVEQLRQKLPRVTIETGAVPTDTTRLALRAPKVLYGRAFFDDTIQVALDFPSFKGVSLYYTLDEAASPTTQSAQYRDKIVLRQTARLRAFAAKDGWLPSPVVEALLVKKKFTPVAAKVLKEPSPQYPAKGAPSLIDGAIAEEQGAATWLGYEGEHLSATLDLGRVDTVRRVFVHCLENNVAWIFKPVAIQVDVSSDGKTFRPQGSSLFEVNKAMGETKTHLLGCDLPRPVAARYIRVAVKNLLKNPPWHPGKGQKCWIFVDELLVE